MQPFGSAAEPTVRGSTLHRLKRGEDDCFVSPRWVLQPFVHSRRTRVARRGDVAPQTWNSWGASYPNCTSSLLQAELWRECLHSWRVALVPVVHWINETNVLVQRIFIQRTTLRQDPFVLSYRQRQIPSPSEQSPDGLISTRMLLKCNPDTIGR